MTATWFTSDLHIRHTNQAIRRGIDNIDEHDDILARNWDRLIRPQDHVWMLGDLTGRRGHEQAGIDWIAQRPGVKYLIAGNHDSCHPLHSRAHKEQSKYLEVFAAVQQSATIKIQGHRVLLSHFPYSADHTEVARYPEWRFQNRGQWLIHGHTHSTEKVKGKEIHVGVDAHDLAPVSLHWIEHIIKESE